MDNGGPANRSNESGPANRSNEAGPATLPFRELDSSREGP
jgi:hypothetical protein